MEEKQIKINKWLLPLSHIYGAATYFRNKLFDWGILQSKSFNIPTIC
ncbi:MAG: tetraacyldisaccharide 4'-kinase, partial [Bacteroides graminisolvens]|nr:tetraacyldisaccharide 4'-kinase [Bacteroides graminisolvens]